MGRFGVTLVVLATAYPVLAQPGEFRIPAVTPPQFSRIVGKYSISSSASPTEVQVEMPVTLTVHISGQGLLNYQPQRRHLRIFPDEIADDFYVEEVPDEDRAPASVQERVWTFVYRLRPKHVKVQAIPELRLLYYVPGGRGFQSTFAPDIPIKVTPPPEPTPAKLGLKVVVVPDRFYHLRSVEDVLRDDTPLSRPGPGVLLALVAGPPLACWLWYARWRRCHPNAAESTQRRRSRAARLALASLADQPGNVERTRAAAVDFLRQRLELTAAEPTPVEVARHLKRLGFATSVVSGWANLLHACDHVRFTSSPSAPGTDLATEAVRLIRELEADPCVWR